ncbi:MAG: sterol desaturase [Bacteroidetes bacterium]|nr:MAG: sterol desaturase [Bacteroidota bacterium]
MEEMISFFDDLQSWQKLFWIVVCLSAALGVENIKPLFKGGFRSWKHTKTNLVFLATLILINVIFGMITVGLFQWIDETGWGLINTIELPLAAELFLTILAFDFIAQYVAHITVHRVKFLWRIHLVHHSDTHVDATTGTRLHPLDFISRESFAVLAVFITGAPFAFYMLYRILTIAFTYFNHSNVSLPLKLDKAISWVIISPNTHKFHHHFEEPWTDRNFGNIFSIWDRIFGTFAYGDVNKIKYGLDVTDDSKSDDLAYQMMLPIRNNGRVKINN